jgi:hypothetical protein
MAKRKSSAAQQQAPSKIAVALAADQIPAGAQVVWRPVWCAAHHFDDRPCDGTRPTDCAPGPQVRTLWSQAYEVIGGGGRGSMKSEAGFGFTVKGNPRLVKIRFLADITGLKIDGGLARNVKAGSKTRVSPHIADALTSRGWAEVVDDPGSPADISYVNHPLYRFLVLRKNADDLRDCFRRARVFYAPFGATFVENPMLVRFPSGAEGVFGHMQDENAYEKWQGQEFQRMWIEELTQIPSELLYQRIILSCRSTVPELVQQVYVTANPGGKGMKWFNKRFWHTTEKGTKLYTDPETGLTREFIHSTVRDNPYFMRDNQQYVAQLMQLDGVERERWLDGSFDAFEGQYFSSFREKRNAGEPETALHVIPAESVPLMSWYPRWIGCDWGHTHLAAVYWGCQLPNGQVHVYRELPAKEMESAALGAEIARQSAQEIGGQENQTITMWLSREIWERRDEAHPIAHLIAHGMRSILGPDSVFIPDSAKEADVDAMMARYREQRRGGIIIRPAQNQRVPGWQFCREMLRWKPLSDGPKEPMDYNLWIKIMHERGQQAADEYRMAFEPKREVLPKLQIWDCCPKLIAAIPTASYAGLEGSHTQDPEDVLKTATDEDDILDAWRYLMTGYRFQQENMPKSAWIQQRMEEAKARHGNLGTNLVPIARHLDAEWDRRHAAPKGFIAPRLPQRSRMFLQ